ncbi:MAG TPA: GNAT family N-acetyltransferase/peptidase C39 family protein [Thiohalobacter sp.]|nr:GNAT family N-acetyltransferase/peptidase C39 family protein [Thiohalobacter sp.]
MWRPWSPSRTAASTSDRLSRRQFRYMLTRANAATLVTTGDADQVLGYALVLFHAGTSLARLYSIAVDPAARGRGLAQTLLTAAEVEAAGRGCVDMRLEVRPDNAAAIALYERLGYRRFGTFDDYYEQTLDFTCGPAALMMAMQALDDTIELSRRTEIRIWRESTTVFMTSGHGGCGPQGLALSAYHRGFDVDLYLSSAAAMFLDSVRSEEKREVIRLVNEDFLDEIEALPIRLYEAPLSGAELQTGFEAGGIPLVLISSYRIYREKFPHWVVVTGFDESFIYVHDPYVDYEKGKTRMDCINMPILKADFERMARYGKSVQRAAIMVKRREA